MKLSGVIVSYAPVRECFTYVEAVSFEVLVEDTRVSVENPLNINKLIFLTLLLPEWPKWNSYPVSERHCDPTVLVIFTTHI